MSTRNEVAEAAIFGTHLGLVNFGARGAGLPDASAPSFGDFQDQSRASVAYPRCRIILDDNDPVEAPWLLPLLALVHNVGKLSSRYAHLAEIDRGVLTRDSARFIGSLHGDVLQDLARLADSHSARLADVASGYLARLAQRLQRAARRRDA